jgi:plastocyanin domain-containing protein
MKSFVLAAAITFQIFNMVSASTNKQTIDVLVTEKGFEPSILKVGKDQEIILAITRKTNSTCAKEILFPAQKIRKELPLNKTVTIDLGKLKKGDVSFSCGMNMVSGVISVK